MIKNERLKHMITIIIRAVFAAAAVILFVLYSPPFLTLGVINAGNLFGFGLSAIFLALAIFYNKLEAIIKAFSKSTGGKAALGIFCLLIIIFFVLFFSTLSCIITNAKGNTNNETTVIVLGCQIRGDEPSYSLKARCNKASEYLKAHPKAIAIASGGQGSDENLSEGQCIYNLMTEDGIDGSRVFIEDKSTSTDQNIENSLKIIEDNGFSKSVAVATTDYHQYRASIICRRNGLEPSSLPSGSTKPSKPTFYTREVFGVWIQKLKD